MKSRIISFVIVLSLIVSIVPGLSLSVSANDSGYFTDTQMKVSESIAESVKNFDESCQVTESLPVDDLFKVMTLVHNNHPELFHLGNSYKYTYKTDEVTGKNYVASVIFSYSMTQSEYSSATNQVNTWIEKINSLTAPTFTDREYALFFHDYLCANYEYDTSFAVHDIYTFIKSGQGVCQSYTYAYTVLLKSVGIEVSWASSTEMNHMWNLVKLDGKWYHIDVTWDDPVGLVPGVAMHTYFMKSDASISSEEVKHYGWVSPYRSTATDYDSNPVSDVSSAFAYMDGKWYYISGGDLYVTDSPFKAGQLHTELNLRWYAWNSSSYYTSDYSGLYAIGEYLYINTPTNIMRVSPESKSVSSIYSYNGKDGYIYGFKGDLGSNGVSGADLSSGQIIATIGTAPTERVKNLKIALEGTVVKGDANGDSKVNISDASLMLKYIAKWSVSINLDNADFDGNSKINLSDVSGVMKKIAGW